MEELSHKQAEQIIRKIVEFATILRREGIGASTSETIDAVHSLLFLDFQNMNQIYLAMRSTLVKSKENQALYEKLFKLFWLDPDQTIMAPRISGAKTNDNSITDLGDKKQRLSKIESTHLAGNVDHKPRVSDSDEPENVWVPKKDIYSQSELLGGKNPFEEIDPEYNSIIRNGVKQFCKRMRMYPGRRNISSLYGEIDFRRTFRTWAGRNWKLPELESMSPKLSKADLVILCDISASMDSFRYKLVPILYHFCSISSVSDVFVFSTRLAQVTPLLRGKSLKEASRSVSEKFDLWNSGTRIGTALRVLLKKHRTSLRQTTTLVVLSDGLELDNLDVLESNMRSIRHRIKGVIWLNPLADDAKYKPIASGMKTVLPYLDVLTGLRILENEKELGRIFVSSKPRERHYARLRPRISV
jgi:uncharacterized protein with von Willebrand factor type A (vWA) domain